MKALICVAFAFYDMLYMKCFQIINVPDESEINLKATF
jgi:hypothetical protein